MKLSFLCLCKKPCRCKTPAFYAGKDSCFTRYSSWTSTPLKAVQVSMTTVWLSSLDISEKYLEGNLGLEAAITVSSLGQVKPRTETGEDLCNVSQVSQTRYRGPMQHLLGALLVLEQLWWVVGLSQGLAWSVVLHFGGCVPLTAAVTASVQGPVLELPSRVGGPKSHLALGHSKKNITIK